MPRIPRLTLALSLAASLMLPAFAVPGLNDDEMMMALMGVGIEDPIAGALAAPMANVDDPPIDFPNASATRAMGINASGDIVGAYDIGGVTHGFLLRQGKFTSIDFPGSVFTQVWRINPQGDMIGRYRIAGDGTARTRGFFLSRDGTFTDISVGTHLHTLPTGLSASGEIVGCFHDTNFLVDMRGYLQRGGAVSSFIGPSTMHNGVTPGGHIIVGIAFETPTIVHSYILTRKGITYFDVPGATFTQAWDVNPSGTVAGYYNPVTSHGFVLDKNGLRTVDVENSLWTRIFGINPQGDIVGSFADGSNRVHGFVMRGRNQG